MFFFKKHGPPVPRGRRLLRVALMMQLSMRPVPAFFDFCILQTYWFFNPVSVFFAQKGPPNEFFCNFFGCVFGPARVQISSTLVLRSGFFCSVKKMCSKAPAGYAGWGPLTDPLLHVLPPQLAKQKSKNQKKRKFC